MSRKSPTVQLASKRRELGRLEVVWQNLRSKSPWLEYSERPPTWHPLNDVSKLFVGKHSHQLQKKRSGERLAEVTIVTPIGVKI
jgi:hypothetical protein